MWKVIKEIGTRKVAKYYESEIVANKKAEYKGWKKFIHKGDMEYSARGINPGELKAPKYEIEIPSLKIKFGVPTEGLANQIVELLTENYKEVRARHLVKKEDPEDAATEYEGDL